MKNNLQIAIDGPVASGKGTLAVRLAKKINAFHIYSGGMYRALALACLRRNIDINDGAKVLDVLYQIEIGLRLGKDFHTRILLDGEDVSGEIFFPEVSNITPITSKYPEVRHEMVNRQRELAKDRSVIMEGRDITTVVLPNADLKVFLTADIDIRAKRRLDQLEDKNANIDFETVKKDIEKRDMADTVRDASPLTQADDAFAIDTSNDTIEETVEKVLNELKKRGLL